MSTKYRNPRVIVAFKPHEYDIVKRLAAVTGTTMSKALHGQIEAVLPVLEKVVESLEAAQRTKGAARAKLLAQAMALHTEMDEVAAHALNQFDLFVSAAQGHAAASACERSDHAEQPRTVGGDATRSREKARPAPATRRAVRAQEARKHARKGK